MTKNTITLLELNQLVSEAISLTLPDAYWVEAELSEAREAYNGHCYMELIEKDERSNTPVAKAHANCWANRWRTVSVHFERTTGQRLHAGMKVLLLVHAQFHPNYGFSWIVDDIDPTYTMGDMARKRQEIIAQLKAEGVYDLQKELCLPLFCQRIAVISSATAAGYGDFCNQLANNEQGFQFHTNLFPATMQGEGVEQSVVAALDRINSEWEAWDCVVIIRGGGATSDLSGFDTLTLAENVANFPLPVITGIGHDRDESVLDMISFQRVKTPTAAAAFLIDHLAEVAGRVESAVSRAALSVDRRLRMEHLRLERLTSNIPHMFAAVKTRQQAYVDNLLMRAANTSRTRLRDELYHISTMEESMKPKVLRRLTEQRHRLQLLEQRVELQDPERLLRRGYSITLCDGKSVKDASTLQEGAIIETRLAKGSVKSRLLSRLLGGAL